MSDQEMQFADPDWKPTRPLDKNKAQQEQEAYTPQPINVEPQEQQRWQNPAPLLDYQEGYVGSAAKLPPVQPTEYPLPGSYRDTAPQGIGAGQFKQRQSRGRRRSPWFWIIIAVIILGLMSGGFGSAFGGRDSPFDRGFGFHNTVAEIHNFSVVGSQPTVVINDASGNIQIHSGGSSGSVNVQAIKQPDGFGNPKNEQVNYEQSPDGKTDTITFTGQGGSVDFNVTVPDNSSLNLQTNSGDITVDSINGQISMSTGSGDITATNDNFSGTTILKTNSGNITAKQDQLQGPATLETGSGDITFDGTINGTGNNQFTTGSGDIDATLNGSTAVDVTASTDNGSVTSGVPTVSVQNNDSGSTATGYVGTPNTPTKLTLKTNDGSINLDSQP